MYKSPLTHNPILYNFTPCFFLSAVIKCIVERFFHGNSQKTGPAIYVFRGGNAAIARSNRFTAKGLVIDYDKYRVYIDGNDANLTQNEFKLVALLGRYAGRVLTYDYLIREIWGPNKAYDNQILRVNMANIRRKIEADPGRPEYIFTEVGVGYRMREGD